MLKEFKEFIMRGNVMDLAVAVIIGGAFGKIVTSLVSDILMPLIGLIIGGIDFSGLAFTVGSAKVTYGNFINIEITLFEKRYSGFVLSPAGLRIPDNE